MTMNLNPMIAAQLKLILKRNDISIELNRQPGVDTYRVLDPKGEALIVYSNGWDYGMYSITALGETVADIQWSENENKTTPEQKAVFEIGSLIGDKMRELEQKAKMSEAEKSTFEKLAEYTKEISK